jgi:hypothetical protein
MNSPARSTRPVFVRSRKETTRKKEKKRKKKKKNTNPHSEIQTRIRKKINIKKEIPKKKNKKKPALVIPPIPRGKPPTIYSPQRLLVNSVFTF